MEVSKTTTHQSGGDKEELTAVGVKRKRFKSKRSERKRMTEEAEERRLTALIFGGSGNNPLRSTVERGQLSTNQNTENEKSPHRRRGPGAQESTEGLFEIDRTGADLSEIVDASHVFSSKQERSQSESRHLTPSEREEHAYSSVWVDEEDGELEVNLLDTDRLRKLRTSRTEKSASALNGVELERRMREQYQNTMQRTANTDWADIEVQSDGDNNDVVGGGHDDINEQPLQGSSVPLLRNSAKRRLEPNTLDIVRCPDANMGDPNQSVVRVVQFHPGSDPENPLLFTAGFDKTLRFFQVGVEGSKKIHAIHRK